MSCQCKTSSLQVSVTATTDQQILLLALTSVMCPLIASPHRISKCGALIFLLFSYDQWQTSYQLIVRGLPTSQETGSSSQASLYNDSVLVFTYH